MKPVVKKIFTAMVVPQLNFALKQKTRGLFLDMAMGRIAVITLAPGMFLFLNIKKLITCITMEQD